MTEPSPRRQLLTRILSLIILGILGLVAFFVLKSVTSTQRPGTSFENPNQATESNQP